LIGLKAESELKAQSVKRKSLNFVCYGNNFKIFQLSWFFFSSSQDYLEVDEFVQENEIENFYF